MSLLDADLARELVADAALAPSVRNVQPARWATRPGDTLVLLRAVDRVLPAADPSGREIRVSLGAAFEGAALAASVRGLALRDVRWGPDAHEAVGADAIGGHEVVAAARVTMGGLPDPLAAYVGTRRSWRGPFRGGAATVKALDTVRAEDVHVLPASAAAEVARWTDEATGALTRRADYIAERWSWLRLDPSHPGYHRDGLTAEALLLTPQQRRLARLVFRLGMFRVLRSVGLGRTVVSEADAVRSAVGFLCFCPERSLDDYAVGRRLYRIWLRATSAGLALAAMWPLVDHEPTRLQIAERIALPAHRRLEHVLRAGRLPVEAAPASPRLPVEELLVE